MSEDINFVELVCIQSITPDTVVEKLAGIINSNTFDAFNLAGTLKKKNLIEFTSYLPGPNSIALTESAKQLIAEANSKASEDFDMLDENILVHLYAGKKTSTEMQNLLNINSKDLALHHYKLSKQGYITYLMKTGNVDLLLSEKGFLKASSSKLPKPTPPQMQMKQEAAAAGTSPTHQRPTQHPDAIPDAMVQDLGSMRKKSSPSMLIAIVIILIIIILGALFYLKKI